MGRDRGGVRIVAVRTRQGLSPLERYPGRLGHRGQRPGDGVRQHGRYLGDGRRLHPRSFDRRGGLLRRVPDQRARGRRGRGHPHPAISHARSPGACGRQARLDGRGDARGLRRTRARVRPARAALPRHAGHRVHGGARAFVDAPDAQRQAHRQGRAQDRGRHGERGADHPRAGDPAGRPFGARSVAPSDARSGGAAGCADQGAASVAGRGIGQGRVRRRHRREAGRGGGLR